MEPGELQHFHTHGYVVLSGRVPESLCQAVLRESWERLEAHGIMRNQPKSWAGLNKMGFTELYALPSMWRMRQVPEVYQAFATLLERSDLWVSVDRMGLKRPGYWLKRGQRVSFPGKDHTDVHTDVNLWHPPTELRLQGLVALEDTDVDQGGFACIPGFHHTFRQWTQDNLDARRPARQTFVRFRDKALIESSMTPIPMKKGDLLIWNALLPHTNTSNQTDRWRACQYVTFFPAHGEHRQMQEQARYAWSTGRPPSHFPGGKARFKDLPTHDRKDGYVPTELSQLGKRLLGIEAWSAPKKHGAMD